MHTHNLDSWARPEKKKVIVALRPEKTTSKKQREAVFKQSKPFRSHAEAKRFADDFNRVFCEERA